MKSFLSILVILLLLGSTVVVAEDNSTSCTGFWGSVSCFFLGDASKRAAIGGKAWWEPTSNVVGMAGDIPGYNSKLAATVAGYDNAGGIVYWSGSKGYINEEGNSFTGKVYVGTLEQMNKYSPTSEERKEVFDNPQKIIDVDNGIPYPYELIRLDSASLPYTGGEEDTDVFVAVSLGESVSDAIKVNENGVLQGDIRDREGNMIKGEFVSSEEGFAYRSEASPQIAAVDDPETTKVTNVPGSTVAPNPVVLAASSSPVTADTSEVTYRKVGLLNGDPFGINTGVNNLNYVFYLGSDNKLYYLTPEGLIASKTQTVSSVSGNKVSIQSAYGGGRTMYLYGEKEPADVLLNSGVDVVYSANKIAGGKDLTTAQAVTKLVPFVTENPEDYTVTVNGKEVILHDGIYYPLGTVAYDDAHRIKIYNGDIINIKSKSGPLLASAGTTGSVSLPEENILDTIGSVVDRQLEISSAQETYEQRKQFTATIEDQERSFEIVDENTLVEINPDGSKGSTYYKEDGEWKRERTAWFDKTLNEQESGFLDTYVGDYAIAKVNYDDLVQAYGEDFGDSETPAPSSVNVVLRTSNDQSITLNRRALEDTIAQTEDVELAAALQKVIDDPASPEAQSLTVDEEGDLKFKYTSTLGEERNQDLGNINDPNIQNYIVSIGEKPDVVLVDVSTPPKDVAPPGDIPTGATVKFTPTEVVDLLDQYNLEGTYSDESNAALINELHRQGLLTDAEYAEINGDGIFNVEENMGYVRDLIAKKYGLVAGPEVSAGSEPAPADVATEPVPAEVSDATSQPVDAEDATAVPPPDADVAEPAPAPIASLPTAGEEAASTLKLTYQSLSIGDINIKPGEQFNLIDNDKVTNNEQRNFYFGENGQIREYVNGGWQDISNEQFLDAMNNIDGDPVASIEIIGGVTAPVSPDASVALISSDQPIGETVTPEEEITEGSESTPTPRTDGAATEPAPAEVPDATSQPVDAEDTTTVSPPVAPAVVIPEEGDDVPSLGGSSPLETSTVANLIKNSGQYSSTSGLPDKVQIGEDVYESYNLGGGFIDYCKGEGCSKTANPQLAQISGQEPIVSLVDGTRIIPSKTAYVATITNAAPQPVDPLVSAQTKLENSKHFVDVSTGIEYTIVDENTITDKEGDRYIKTEEGTWKKENGGLFGWWDSSVDTSVGNNFNEKIEGNTKAQKDYAAVTQALVPKGTSLIVTNVVTQGTITGYDQVSAQGEQFFVKDDIVYRYTGEELVPVGTRYNTAEGDRISITNPENLDYQQISRLNIAPSSGGADNQKLLISVPEVAGAEGGREILVVAPTAPSADSTTVTLAPQLTPEQEKKMFNQDTSTVKAQKIASLNNGGVVYSTNIPDTYFKMSSTGEVVWYNADGSVKQVVSIDGISAVPSAASTPTSTAPAPSIGTTSALVDRTITLENGATATIKENLVNGQQTGGHQVIVTNAGDLTAAQILAEEYGLDKSAIYNTNDRPDGLPDRIDIGGVQATLQLNKGYGWDYVDASGNHVSIPRTGEKVIFIPEPVPTKRIEVAPQPTAAASTPTTIKPLEGITVADAYSYNKVNENSKLPDLNRFLDDNPKIESYLESQGLDITALRDGNPNQIRRLQVGLFGADVPQANGKFDEASLAAMAGFEWETVVAPVPAAGQPTGVPSVATPGKQLTPDQNDYLKSMGFDDSIISSLQTKGEATYSSADGTIIYLKINANGGLVIDDNDDPSDGYYGIAADGSFKKVDSSREVSSVDSIPFGDKQLTAKTVAEPKAISDKLTEFTVGSGENEQKYKITYDKDGAHVSQEVEVNKDPKCEENCERVKKDVPVDSITAKDLLEKSKTPGADKVDVRVSVADIETALQKGQIYQADAAQLSSDERDKAQDRYKAATDSYNDLNTEYQAANARLNALNAKKTASGLTHDEQKQLSALEQETAELKAQRDAAQDEQTTAKKQSDDFESQVKWRSTLAAFEGVGQLATQLGKLGKYPGLSNLLFPETTKAWQNWADNEFLNTWADIPGRVTREACQYDQKKRSEIPGKSVAFIHSKGSYQFVGSLQAEKSISTTPMMCERNTKENATEEWICPKESVCVNSMCYKGDDPEEIDPDFAKPIQGYVYKITWGVTAPQDLAQTPYVDENGIAVKLNLLLEGSTRSTYIFKRSGVPDDEAIELKNGASDGGTIFKALEDDYVNVCVKFKDGYQVKDDEGDFVDEICADFIPSAQGMVDYGKSGGSSSFSTTSSSTEVEMNI